MVAASNNIIAFPKKNMVPKVQAPISPEEVALNVGAMKLNHINETLMVLVPMVFANIEVAGFDFVPEDNEDDPNVKDGALFVETLRSLLCKYYGIGHPLQKVADELFVQIDADTFELADSLMIEFDNEEKGNG